jgi:hypothetical protein
MYLYKLLTIVLHIICHIDKDFSIVMNIKKMLHFRTYLLCVQVKPIVQLLIRISGAPEDKQVASEL